MLEQYFSKPDTVDRIRDCWLGEPIERYVTWLSKPRLRRAQHSLASTGSEAVCSVRLESRRQELRGAS